MTAFPDVEVAARALLLTVAGSGVGVTADWPAPIPASHVRCWVTGGSAVQRVFERPLLTVTAKAEDRATASAIASRCREVFLARYGAAAEVTRPYFDPDPDTGAPRFTFSFRVRNRAND